MVEIKITPVAKPRMTRSDIWKHRPIVDRYFAFKDNLVLLCNVQHFKLPEKYKVEFLMPMPAKWPIKKKVLMTGKPHKQRPDLDNLLKALNDCLLKEDSGVWYIEASKIWWDEGKIIFYKT